MNSLDDLLNEYEMVYGDLCPGQVLAIRMAMLGCNLVGYEEPLGHKQRKLIVWVEIDRWLVDAVEAVTGARLGKRTLKFLDYGKLAATFLNVDTGKAVRIVALESSRGLADQLHPEIEVKFLRQMTVYREARNEELFAVEEVDIKLSELDTPGHPHGRTICTNCGEGVNDGREIRAGDGNALCRPCAFATTSALRPPFALHNFAT